MNAAGIKEKERDLQIGDLTLSYSPFDDDYRHPALVIGERTCPEYGRILKLLVTLPSGESTIDEWPVEHW